MWNVETNETITAPVFASRQEVEQLLRPPPVRQQNPEQKTRCFPFRFDLRLDPALRCVRSFGFSAAL